MSMGLVNAARQIEAYGMGPDRQLAHISPDEAQLMDTLQGGRRINPETGLPQYGMFGKILKAVARVAATTVGFMYGGPVGAAAASAAATKLTGGSWKEAAISGALSGATAGLGSYAQGTRGLSDLATTTGNDLVQNAASNALASGSGTFAGTAGGQAAWNAAATPTIGQTLANAGQFAMSNPSTAIGMAVPNITSAFQPTPAKSTNNVPNFTPDPKFGGGTLGDAGQRLADRGITSYFGRPIYRNKPADQSSMALTGPMGYSADPSQQNFGGFAKGGSVEPRGLTDVAQLGYVNAKRGGTIKGPGSGTSDDIPAMLSDGEHVLDAELVSLIGSGSNNAGHKKIEEVKKQIRSQAGIKNPGKALASRLKIKSARAA